ncbi:MAG: hypothetical protein K8J08_16190 [Thermoanaerobaculia bacterium]|nr:hypothetical protein [Thermoanaerobaculia bacterium]
MSPARRSSAVRQTPPEPHNFWIRYAPRRWPTPQVPWIDLSRRRLGSWSEDATALVELLDFSADDVVYLPPVSDAHQVAMDDLVAAHIERGVPVVVQALADGSALASGSQCSGEDATGSVTKVVDLLPVALGQLPLGRITPGTVAAWPLLPGGPGVEFWPDLAIRLAELGYRCVQAVPLELDPPDLRVLAGYLPEDSGLGLFHAAPASMRLFVRTLLEAGLSPYLDRPLPRPPLMGAGNLEVAGRLHLVGELLHVLDRSPALAADLLRAARFAEELPQDLRGLVRDGHLSVLPWVGSESQCLLEEWAAGKPSSLKQELYAALLSDEEREESAVEDTR